MNGLTFTLAVCAPGLIFAVLTILNIAKHKDWGW